MRTVFIFLFVLGIYLLTGHNQHTGHHFFVPLTEGFLQGRLYVDTMQPELHEMVPDEEIRTSVYTELVDGQQGKYYVIFPPLPAAILIPFVALWGSATNQSIVSVLIAALTAMVAYLVFVELKLGRERAMWLTILYALGSGLWYHALVGSAWYFSSVCGLLFMWLAILAVVKRANPLVVGACVGLAYLCRYSLILSIPFFVYVYISVREMNLGKRIRTLLPFFCGVLIFVGVSFWYNWARYGSIGHVGYSTLEKRPYNITNEYTDGSYSLAYLPRNLKAMFWTFPDPSAAFPYVTPNMFSMAIWIVFPAIFLILFSRLRAVWAQASVIGILFLLPASLFHGGVGASQFGYRYSLDYLPFVMLLIATSLQKDFGIGKKLLIELSILVNAWGIYMILWR